MNSATAASWGGSCARAAPRSPRPRPGCPPARGCAAPPGCAGRNSPLSPGSASTTTPAWNAARRPEVGTLTLGYQSMQLEGTPGQRLSAYYAQPATPDHDAMIRPSIWPLTSPPRPPPPASHADGRGCAAPRPRRDSSLVQAVAPDTPPIMACGNSFPLVRDLHSHPPRSRERQLPILPGEQFRGINSNTLTILARSDSRPVTPRKRRSVWPFPDRPRRQDPRRESLLSGKL